ncbi:chromosomal replication initiator protein DnaA [Sphingosinicella soli]|nr:chromosomal replication initiator protein DnaA [Sphingosinicella soli]
MFLSGTDSAESIWQTIRAHLRAEYGARTYDSWLKPLALVSVDADTVTLGSPTHFTADWIRNHFAERLRLLWSAQSASIQAVRIIVENGLKTTAAAEPVHPAPATVREETAFGVALEPRYTFDSFVVGKANELAYNAARTVAEGGPIDFNPLFLYGTTGLGKTHLMHAIGWHLRNAVPGAKVVYMSAEKFMVEFVSAIRDKDTLSFKQKLRTADLLMIDDVQFIAGKDSTQEEFFHTMNEIISAGKRLIITADRSPQNLEGIENRILSRLAWGLVADINPADYELRLSILLEKIKRMPGANVGEDVIDFLARKITSNVRELEGALNRIVAYSTLVGKPIDLDFARQVLADVLKAHDRKVTIDEIQRKVADYYAIKLSDLLSARRAREVARPRQVAMFLAKRLTPRSLPDIGRRFGGRDHTTVMHAVKRIEELRADDSELDADITRLTRIIDA